jgi:hypothetical protein
MKIPFAYPALALALLVACKSEETATKPELAPDPKPEPARADDPGAEEAGRREGQVDPQRADKLADLEDLCKALDRDYVDGTLSDYYRDIEPRTEWGKAQRKAGNESMQPGRLLEKAVAELSADTKDPALEHCRKLLDYLDDVE